MTRTSSRARETAIAEMGTVRSTSRPVGEGEAILAGYRVPIPRTAASAADDSAIVLGFRPEALELAGEADEGLPVTVQEVEELGSDAYVYGALGESEVPDVIARIDPERVPARGSRVRLAIRPGKLHLFSAATGERLAA